MAVTLSAEEKLEKLLDLQTMLARVSRQIGPALDLGHVLSTVLDAMRELIKFKGGTICLVDEEMVYIAAADPIVSPDVQAARLPVGQGLAGRIVRDGQALYSPNLDNDPRVVPGLRKLGTNSSIVSYLGVPLICLGEVIGVLQVDSAEEDAFDQEDTAVLEGLATQVAGAIESARRYEQSQDLERLKADFISRVSHELRTPLTIMAGFTKTLIARGDSFSRDEQRSMLERVDSATGRLGALIEELLAVNMFEQSPKKLRIESIQILPLAEGVAATSVDPDLVTFDIDADLMVTADVRLLRMCLGLLVDNAIKYARGCRIVADPTVISVVDQGPGIPKEINESSSQMFNRGTLAQPGLGLGLSRVRSMAAVMGADLVIKSPPTGGTVVSLIFG